MANRSSDSQTHKHYFSETTGRCTCGCYAISREEFGNRCSKWDTHYAKCRQSPSAKNFEVAMKAYRLGNLEVVRECARRATLRLQESNYLPKPNFDDPRSHKWSEVLEGEGIVGYLYHDPSGDY